MFYNQLMKLCQEKNEKPTAVIRSLGFSATNLKRWKNGSTVNSEILKTLADHFGVSVDYFFQEGGTTMKFYDKTHEQAYTALMERMKVTEKDVYRTALAYLITLDKVCGEHIENIYDFSDNCIIPECLNEGWQTGTSRKTTLLAFNLFTGHTNWMPENYSEICTPDNIFCCSYAPYYWEAIKLRYPEYITA